MILKPGMWIRLRRDEDLNPWETLGVVIEIDYDRMEARVHFANGELDWVPIFDLLLLK